jgi:small subunit ribosomal protein S16
MGKKKQPFYRIVVADSRMPRDGRAVEELGTYNPVKRPGTVTLQEERVYEWLGKGALPSDTVNSLFRRLGVLSKYAMISAGKDVSAVTIKTELTEQAKPSARAKKTAKAAKAEAAAAEAAAAPEPEAPAAEEPAAEPEAPAEKAE